MRAAVGSGRVPRVSRLLALALRLDRLVHAGAIADYATLARLGHVSRARVSQILGLVLLAPDIQETCPRPSVAATPSAYASCKPWRRYPTGGTSAADGMSYAVPPGWEPPGRLSARFRQPRTP
jgi:hypothetical protein